MTRVRALPGARRLRDQLPASSATATSSATSARVGIRRGASNSSSRPRTCRPRPRSQPIVGEHDVHTLDDLKAKREQEVVVRACATRSSRRGEFPDRPWLFPQLVEIVTRLDRRSSLQPQGPRLPAAPAAARASEPTPSSRSTAAIVAAERASTAPRRDPRAVRPDRLDRDVDFDTTKPVMATDPQKCHVSTSSADSDWEHVMTSRLEIDGRGARAT